MSLLVSVYFCLSCSLNLNILDFFYNEALITTC